MLLDVAARALSPLVRPAGLDRLYVARLRFAELELAVRLIGSARLPANGLAVR